MAEKVYICGPMTGLPEFNYPAFFKAADRAKTLGLKPLNPAKNAPKGWMWGQYLRRSLKMVEQADLMWLLPGWEYSEGARAEFRAALDRKLPIYELINLQPQLYGEERMQHA